jgi:hypothetical protein
MQIGARTTGGVVGVRVTTGGSGYSSRPTVTIAGGSGASAHAIMAGTVVDSVVVSSAGTGYTAPTVSFSGGGGTGAAAVGYAYTGPLRPMSFYKGRYNDLYGVDGMGRGIRWDGAASAVQPIGVHRPATAPAVVATAATSGGHLSDIQIVNPGAGYFAPPTITLTGGSPTTPATARAILVNGQIVGATISERGAGYQSTPTVSFSGGIGSGATLSVGVLGQVDGVRVLSYGSGYTSNATTTPTLQFSTAQGLTGATAAASVDSLGRIFGVNILSSGTGATATGVTATVIGGGGTGAVVAVDLKYRVSAVTVASGGTGYFTAPVITFRAASTDVSGNGAAATANVNAAGSLTGATVYSGGAYYAPPTAIILNTQATAQATIAQSMAGKYKCAIRYLDGTAAQNNGPIPSSISHLQEVDVGDSASLLTWTFSHGPLDDRVAAMELWRTTGDQSVLLFRVATIQRTDPAFTTSYVDTFSDIDLQDTERAEYGVMPVTLPSGQLNARRFGVPPGNFAVACMFQDRAWYAVDTTGERPNSLLYSEVDEPESVPEENELIVQENTSTPDSVVALIPLGGQLLIAQTSHLYALNYVAQPVLDASVLLVAYRGILNAQCWDVIGGAAVLVDSNGMYAFDGSKEEALSVPVDNYWRDSIIDFSKSSQFHVKADIATKTVRLFYCRSADQSPVRALCYCFATKAWWEETYPQAITATCQAGIGSKQEVIIATAGGAFLKSAGLSDGGTAIPYVFQTGNASLSADQNRSVAVIYKPTEADSTLSLSLHYNNSPLPRPNAIASDRGDGFTTTHGATSATLNMNRQRSALGEANGFAQARYTGRLDDRSAGGDRHVAVRVSGEQSSDPVAIYALRVSGAD